MALALQALQNIAERATEAWLKAVDMTLVVACAREAPDSPVRNAALSLLAVLAANLPDTAVQHALEVSPGTALAPFMPFIFCFDLQLQAKQHGTGPAFQLNLAWHDACRLLMHHHSLPWWL